MEIVGVQIPPPAPWRASSFFGKHRPSFMQVTETSAEGLKREFRVVVPAGELEEKVTSRLGEIGRTIQLRGFRPGKVPMQILRQRFGTSVRGEVLESTLQDSSADAIREHNLRPALPPKVDIVSFSEGTDLEYKMSLEVLPDIPEPSFADLEIERLVVEVPDEDVDRAIERIAEQQRKTEVAERPAESGDIIVVDIEGRSGEQEIPGASGKDRQIVLGSGGFIPGFEEQLIGAAAGEHRTVRVTFPEDYGAPDFAGKDAVFEVDVKEVRQRLPLVIDDELGKAVGLESLAELRQEVRQQMQRDYEARVASAPEARRCSTSWRRITISPSRRAWWSSSSKASGGNTRRKRRGRLNRKRQARRPAPGAGEGPRGEAGSQRARKQRAAEAG